jgi:hypothetical protein
MSDDLAKIFDEVTGKTPKTKEKPKKKAPVKEEIIPEAQEEPTKKAATKKKAPKEEVPKQEVPKAPAKAGLAKTSSTIDDFFTTGNAGIAGEDAMEKPDQEPDLVDQPQIHITKEMIPQEAVISSFETKQYDTSPEKPSLQQTFMMYSLKGGGKTHLALSSKGKISAISFDRKTSKVWIKDYNKDPRITIYDGIRYLRRKSADEWLESAVESVYYIMQVLKTIEKNDKPDWILIDGSDIMIGRICEMAMRYRNRFKAFQPFKWDYWRERNMYVDMIYDECLRIAKHGVIYTAYVTDKAFTIKNGIIVEQKRLPKWAANLKTQVDTVIHLESTQAEGSREFWATVESSKTPELKTGLRVDITGAGIQKMFKESK